MTSTTGDKDSRTAEAVAAFSRCEAAEVDAGSSTIAAE